MNTYTAPEIECPSDYQQTLLDTMNITMNFSECNSFRIVNVCKFCIICLFLSQMSEAEQEVVLDPLIEEDEDAEKEVRFEFFYFLLLYRKIS